MAALANQPQTVVVRPDAPLCFCGREYDSGTQPYTKACKVPEYEDHLWVSPCHDEKNSPVKKSAPPASHSHSRKTNHTEEAAPVAQRQP